MTQEQGDLNFQPKSELVSIDKREFDRFVEYGQRFKIGTSIFLERALAIGAYLDSTSGTSDGVFIDNIDQDYDSKVNLSFEFKPEGDEEGSPRVVNMFRCTITSELQSCIEEIVNKHSITAAHFYVAAMRASFTISEALCDPDCQVYMRVGGETSDFINFSPY